MTKTQIKLIERILSGHSGSYALGWWIYKSKTTNSTILSLSNLLDGEQAHKLADKYPNIFESSQVSFRCVRLTVLSLDKLIKLVRPCI